MNGLVGYASSEDESDDGLNQDAQVKAAVPGNGHAIDHQDAIVASITHPKAPEPESELKNEPATVARATLPADSIEPPETLYDGSMSPYSAARARIQSVTMPRYPDFNIPASPPPPEPMTSEAAALAATTKKFERFRELKKQGIHFNARLESSSALRNPALSQKLFEFADIEPSEQYENTLGEEFGVPMRWPAGFLETLIKDNDRRVLREKEGRSKVDFVPAKKAKR